MKSKLIKIVAAVAAVVLVGVWLLMPSPLHRAANNGNIEAVKKHLADGADVDAKSWELFAGLTPLYLAAGEGHKEVAELLIAKGADVNVKIVSGPNQGSTPLDAANGTNHPKIADLLRKHGGKSGEELKAKGK